MCSFTTVKLSRCCDWPIQRNGRCYRSFRHSCRREPPQSTPGLYHQSRHVHFGPHSASCGDSGCLGMLALRVSKTKQNKIIVGRLRKQGTRYMKFCLITNLVICILVSVNVIHVDLECVSRRKKNEQKLTIGLGLHCLELIEKTWDMWQLSLCTFWSLFMY